MTESTVTEISTIEYPLTLPDWAVQRIVRGGIHMVRLPVMESNSRPGPNHTFEDFDFAGARRSVGGTHLVGECGSVEGEIRPRWEGAGRFWVLEAFKTERRTCDEDFDTSDEPNHVCDAHCNQTYVLYRATPRIGYRPVPDRASITYLDDSTPLTRRFTEGFSPAFEIRREWSRIELKIHETFARPLQDTSDIDADQTIFCNGSYLPLPNDVPDGAGLEWFRKAWDAAQLPMHRWDANPWTWVAVISTRVCGRPTRPRLSHGHGLGHTYDIPECEMTARARRIAETWPFRYEPKCLVIEDVSGLRSPIEKGRNR